MSTEAPACASDRRLAGRVALITGAGPGLGSAIGLAMAEAGAHVVLCDIDQAAIDHSDRLLAAVSKTHLPLLCDVSDSAAVDRMFAKVVQNYGRVDVLVNNAARVPTSLAETQRRNLHYGYATQPVARRSLGIVSSLSDDDWLKWWDVNMHGVFYCTRAALRHMEPQKYGKIINIASVAGLGAGSMHSPGYSATKAGVISLTRTTAYDVAGANIQVNAIACGVVLTPDFENFLAQCTEEQRARLYQQVPAGRLGRPEEYASLAVYLASDQHYLVGQVISPNGGYVI